MNDLCFPLCKTQLGSLLKSTSVTDNLDGTFRAQYSTRRAGLYTVAVYYSGQTTVSSETGLAERMLVDRK